MNDNSGFSVNMDDDENESCATTSTILAHPRRGRLHVQQQQQQQYHHHRSHDDPYHAASASTTTTNDHSNHIGGSKSDGRQLGINGSGSWEEHNDGKENSNLATTKFSTATAAAAATLGMSVFVPNPPSLALASDDATTSSSRVVPTATAASNSMPILPSPLGLHSPTTNHPAAAASAAATTIMENEKSSSTYFFARCCSKQKGATAVNGNDPQQQQHQQQQSTRSAAAKQASRLYRSQVVPSSTGAAFGVPEDDGRRLHDFELDLDSPSSLQSLSSSSTTMSIGRRQHGRNSSLAPSRSSIATAGCGDDDHSSPGSAGLASVQDDLVETDHVIREGEDDVPVPHSTSADDETSPYEWAYAVWRRKNLLPPKLEGGSLKPRVPEKQQPRGQSAISSQASKAVTSSFRPKAKTMDDQKFANVLQKWKAISDENTTAAPPVPAPAKPASKETTSTAAVTASVSSKPWQTSSSSSTRRSTVGGASTKTTATTMIPHRSSVTATTTTTSTDKNSVSRGNYRSRPSYIPHPNKRNSLVGDDLVPKVAPPTDAIATATAETATKGTGTSSAAVPRRRHSTLQEDAEAAYPVPETPKSQAWKLKVNHHEPKSTLQQQRQRMRATLAATVPSTIVTIVEKKEPPTTKAATTVTTNKASTTPSKGSGFRSYISPPMSRSDYKSLVQDFLRDVGVPTPDKVTTVATSSVPGTKHQRSKSLPRTWARRRDDKAVVSPPPSILTTDPLSLDGALSSLEQPTLEVNVANGRTSRSLTRASLAKERSKSQPRSRLLSDSSLTAIRSQLQREREAMQESLMETSPTKRNLDGNVNATSKQLVREHEQIPHQFGNTSFNNVDRTAARVMDLSIDNYDEDALPILSSISNKIPCEVQVVKESTTKNEAAAGGDNGPPDDLFSPFTQRVMRNLEKVYQEEESDPLVPTPRGVSSRSDRPWQRDRFLHRVESWTDEKNVEEQTTAQCVCSKSVFSGNDEMIDFYLPLMGTACTCGSSSSARTTFLPNEVPTSLVHILRPWQVSFLGGFGIYRGEELVKANHRSGAALANALQRYRKKEGMTPFRTKSCVMALQIWSKTSKAFVRSIRNQIKAARSSLPESVQTSQHIESGGKTSLKVPNTLYIVASFLDQMPGEGGAPTLSMVPSSGGTSTTTTAINTAESISSCSRSSDENAWAGEDTPTSTVAFNHEEHFGVENGKRGRI